MRNRGSVAGVRIASVLAVACALAIPWFGWSAFAAAVVFVLAGALLAPRPTHPHRGRIRLLADAVRRRLVRSPWRPRRR